MKHKLMRRLMKRFIPWAAFLLILSIPVAAAPNFIGNILASGVPANFTVYWNQITSENAAKWGSVESSQDNMNWGSVDSHYNYAREKGYPYKFHTFVWGNQEPGWIGGLSSNDQRAEVEEWIRAAGQRYSPDFIDVVNEPLHAPASFRNALGGSGSSGWEWVVESFRMARKYCTGQLILNDYGIVNDASKVREYIVIINALKSENLIDAIGIQCHHFNVDDYSVSVLQNNLDTLAGTGLPIYVSELDMQGDDNTQLRNYRDKFPVFYNHPSVRGITLWGYIQGQTWRDNTHLVSSGSIGASERPAMSQVLKPYLGGDPPATPTPPGPTNTPDPNANISVRARGTKGGEKLEVHVGGVVADTFTMTTSYQTFVTSGNGGIEIHFTNDDNVDDGMDAQVDYIIYNGTTYQAEDQAVNTAVWQDDSCGGSYSEMMHCAGYIRFDGTGPIVTPTPPVETPTPIPGQGYVSFGTDDIKGNLSGLDVPLYVNSGNQKVAAYSISVSYSSSLLSIDTSKGSDGFSGVSVGSDGFISAINDLGNAINISGFDPTGKGKGPGEKLHLLTLHFAPQKEGSGNLSVAVSELTDASYNVVGNPSGGSATVVISKNDWIRGDVNGDGKISIQDALMAAQYAVGLNPPGYNIDAGDANCDGKYTILDALLIAQVSVGNGSFPC